MPADPRGMGGMQPGRPVPVPPGPLTAETVARMIDQGILNALSPDFFKALGRELTDKNAKENRVPTWHPGTVIADFYDGSTHECSLWLDGDPQDQDHVSYAQVLVPQILFPGQRIMAQYAPPHQAYITGTVGPFIPPGVRLTDRCNNTTNEVFNTASTDVVYFCQEDATSGMTWDGDATIFAPADGLYMTRFSANVTVSGGATPTLTITRISTTIGGNMAEPATASFVSTGPATLVALRVSMRKGDSLKVVLSNVGTGSALLDNPTFEATWQSPFITQTGCSCGGE